MPAQEGCRVSLPSCTGDYTLLLSLHGVSDGLDRLILPEHKWPVPAHPDLRPHATCLARHRGHGFKHWRRIVPEESPH